MKMHQRTIATLTELESKNWFVNVGKRDSDHVVFLTGWDEAIKSCMGEPWESLCQEAVNQYRTRLLERDKLRFRDWNLLVREIKGNTVPLVLNKTKKVVDANQLPKGFIDTVQWDILNLCMEAEYADIFPPGFFASQAFWYIKGHFPCGWEGNFPNGKLVVF